SMQMIRPASKIPTETISSNQWPPRRTCAGDRCQASDVLVAAPCVRFHPRPEIEYRCTPINYSSKARIFLPPDSAFRDQHIWRMKSAEGIARMTDPECSCSH